MRDYNNPETFFKFIDERERVRKRKSSGMPFPWTKEPILRDWKFTNIRREDDMVSVFLWEELFQHVGNFEQAVLTAWCARRINRADQGELWVDDIRNQRWDEHMDRFTNDGSKRLFTNPNSFRQIRTDHIVGFPMLREIVSQIPQDSIEEACDFITEHVRGSGTFFSGQVILDVAWLRPNAFTSDRDIWAPLGPGSKAGLSLLGVEHKFASKAFVKLQQIYNNRTSRELDLIRVIDVEHALCEFAKHKDRFDGIGTPRMKYREGKNPHSKKL